MYSYVFVSLSLAVVGQENEAKLSRERRRSVTDGVQGDGNGGGVAVVGKPRLLKARRARQTG